MKLEYLTIPVFVLWVFGQAAQAQAPGNGARPPQDVNVLNEVAVAVSNTPGVTIANAPDVHVASLPPLTLNTDIRLPYQKTVSTDWNTAAVNVIVDVPSGNRFVIEHISVSASMHPQVEFISMGIFPTVNGLPATHFFTLEETAAGFTGSNTYSGSHSVRLYADESFLSRFMKVNVGGPAGAMEMGTVSLSVSGYLIPYTSPDLTP